MVWSDVYLRGTLSGFVPLAAACIPGEAEHIPPDAPGDLDDVEFGGSWGEQGKLWAGGYARAMKTAAALFACV